MTRVSRSPRKLQRLKNENELSARVPLFGAEADVSLERPEIR